MNKKQTDKKILKYWLNFKKLDTDSKIFFIFFAALVVLIVSFLIQCVILWIIPSDQNFYLFNSTLFFNDRTDSFMDFFGPIFNIRKNFIYEGIYPPLANLFFLFFSLIIGKNNFSNRYENGRHLLTTTGGIISLIIYFAVIYYILFLLLYKVCKKHKIATKKIIFLFLILFFSGPNLFALQRGNSIFFALIFSAIFLMYYNSEKKELRELASISFALAVCFKIYPFILIIVYLFEEKPFSKANLKKIVKSCFYVTLLLFLPFVFFPGGFSNIIDMFKNAIMFTGKGINDAGINGYFVNTAYTSALDKFFYIFLQLFSIYYYDLWLIILTKVIAVIFGIFLLISAFLTKSQWKKICALILFIIFIPFSSSTYTYIFVFIPLLYFLFKKDKKSTDNFYLILFIFILNPLQLGEIIKIYVLKENVFVSTQCFLQLIATFILATSIIITSFKDYFKFKREKLITQLSP